MTGTPWVDAFIFGIISAVSLPLGALLSFIWKPKSKITAALMAFGGGALLAALTIDLVAVAVHNGHFWILAMGCIIGGIFYFFLNQIVNNNGGFLRKTGTALSHLKKVRRKNLNELAKRISTIPLFQQLPADELQSIIPYIQNRTYKTGKHLVHHDDPGDRLLIIESGKVKLIDEDKNLTLFAEQNAVLGEIELLTGSKHEFSIIAETDVSVFMVLKTDFDKIVSQSALLTKKVEEIINNQIELLKENHIVSNEKAEAWYKKAISNLDGKSSSIHSSDLKSQSVKHAGGAALAIWLGIMLDGIPESIVIGSSLLTMGTMSLSLLAGLFLSNFPEALSSSIGLREQKFSKMKILFMWTTIMLLTGVGAIAGNVFFANVTHSYLALIDGLAAGAMLTMIAETMLPEAFHMGGSVTGLSTLIGFLTTIACKFI
ncbi:MAG: cyclic nucleotide-binding domain-containing protein [Bacteroidia bacterium]|nr:cyclic nucleotide-binding domain-containing protein [Bacteroidia bacterium]